MSHAPVDRSVRVVEASQYKGGSLSFTSARVASHPASFDEISWSISVAWTSGAFESAARMTCQIVMPRVNVIASSEVSVMKYSEGRAWLPETEASASEDCGPCQCTGIVSCSRLAKG